MVEYILISAGIFIARYIYKRNEAKIKGNRGERKLCRSLKRLNLPGKVNVLRDCLFQAEWGTSQIDALAVTRYGIIVCEMKNHQGTIYGTVGESNWTVKVGDNCNDLYSPIKQNNSHVSTLIHLLKDRFPNMRFLPIVVFGAHATLHIQNSRNKVCNIQNLHKVITRQLGSEVLSDQEVDAVTSFLKEKQITGHNARRNHITRVQLKAEANDKYTDMDRIQIQKEILESAKNKPVISSGAFVSQLETETSGHFSDDPQRLVDKIKDAEGKQHTASMPNQFHRHDHMVH